MSNPAIRQHLLQVEGLDRRVPAIARARNESFCWHDDTVEPMDATMASRSADDADVAPNNFGENVCDKELWQSGRIGSRFGFLVHSHDVPPWSYRSGGKLGTNICYASCELCVAPQNYGHISTFCLWIETIGLNVPYRNRAVVSKRDLH